MRKTLFCIFPSTSGRVVSHQVRRTCGYMDMPLIWRLWGLRTPILHSAMTKWCCSGCSGRIWNTSRLALSTPVSCDSCVSQATHGQWLKGDPGFWRDNVLGSDRRAISRCHQVKSLGFPPRTTISTTNHTKSVELVGSWQVALERVLLERPDRPDHAGTCQW